MSTGSGSTALLKNIQDIEFEKLRKIVDCLDIKFSDSSLLELHDKLNSNIVFSPDADLLQWVHRELIPYNILHSKDNTKEKQEDARRKRQGFSTEVYTKNMTYESILCVDSNEFEVDYLDEFVFRLCKPHQKLSTITVKQ